MRSIDVHDDLQDGFEPSPLPPIGLDGAPELAPQRPIPPPRPSLCAAGNCENYHRFEVDLAVAQPLPVRRPDGTTVQPERVVHTQVHHHCYPTVGIEMELSAPVATCNRFHPLHMNFMPLDRAQRMPVWLATREGAQYQADVRAWEAARAAEVAAADQTDHELAALLEGHQQERNRETEGDSK